MIAHWLTPEEPARRRLAQLIQEYAERYGGPVFEPHMTILVSSDDEARAGSLVQSIAARIPPLELTLLESKAGDRFTKRLYLQLATTPEVTHLHRELRTNSLEPKDDALDPHVSLLYADVTPEAKIVIPPGLRTIWFDQLHAIVFEPPITTRLEVESWRTIATAKLSV